MRLFIAIDFPDEIKKAVYGVGQELRSKSVSGDFTRYANIHLTLAFIGESDREADVRRIMNGIASKPFPVALSGAGKFRREGGDIWWVGVKPEPALFDLASQLSSRLADAGFAVEDDRFSPHITLGRRVVCTAAASALTIPAASFEADGFSLFSSSRIGPKLVYTELYKRQF